MGTTHYADTNPNSVAVEIEKTEFETFQMIGNNLRAFLAIERIFDAVIENFSDLESEMFHRALDSMHYGSPTAEFHLRAQNEVDRQLLNLFGSCTAYIDQGCHYSSSIEGFDPELHEQFEALTNDEFDQNLDYRIAESLRNFAHHRSLPVSMIRHGGSWDDDFETLHFRFDPKVKVQDVVEDPKFRSKTLDDVLEEYGAEGEISLKGVSRGYVAGIYRVHSKLRKTIEPKFDDWQKRFSDFVEEHDFRCDKTGDPRSVIFVAQDANQEVEESTLILPKLFRNIEFLQHKNENRMSFEKFVVDFRAPSEE